jgi:hypothetical protein
MFPKNNFNNPGAVNNNAIILLLCFYGAIIVIALVVQICFLLTMSRCLREISPRNRRMEPGQVWLCLIPIFGFVWTIIMIIRVSDSLDDEYYSRRLRPDGDFAKTLGIVYIVSAFICGLVAIVCLIMYWVKIVGYTRTLRADRSDVDDDFDDDDDDRDEPRRRKRRRLEYDDDDDYDDQRGRDDEGPRRR